HQGPPDPSVARSALPSGSDYLPGPIRQVPEGEARDVDHRHLQLASGNFTEHIVGMQLVRAGPLENPDKLLGRLVDYLGNFKDLLRASHGSSHQMTPAAAVFFPSAGLG